MSQLVPEPTRRPVGSQGEVHFFLSLYTYRIIGVGFYALKKQHGAGGIWQEDRSEDCALGKARCWENVSLRPIYTQQIRPEPVDGVFAFLLSFSPFPS